MNDLDQRGLPGVSVLTTEFREAFAKQCASIGFEGASLYVSHPMQNRTTSQLHQLAEGSFENVLASLTWAADKEALSNHLIYPMSSVRAPVSKLWAGED